MINDEWTVLRNEEIVGEVRETERGYVATSVDFPSTFPERPFFTQAVADLDGDDWV